METVPGGANYWDLRLLEGHVRLRYFFECDYGEDEVNVLLPIPEETMDELEALIGNGESTITVGKEMKTSKDYESAGSTCFVKLTCNQDIETVLKTREIATTLALGFAEQGYEQARYSMDQLCGHPVGDPPLPLEVISGSEEAPAPKKKTKRKTKKDEDPEPDRKQRPKVGSKRPVLTGKPKFRR